MSNSIVRLLLGLIIFCPSLNAQTFKQQFNSLLSKKDTLAQWQLLKKWEEADNKDAELYVAYFNYYMNKSMTSMLHLGNHPKKGEEALQLMDTDSTKKEPVAFLYGDTYYEPNALKKGFESINKGIDLHPKRLDMRWGKAYMYGKTEDYEYFTTTIIHTVDYSATINNEWLWADNKPLKDGKERMLAAVQDYQVQLFETENDELLNPMQRIAEAVLKHYPDHVESLSNLSIVYILKKDYDNALIPLLKAEKIAPKDYIVLANIARAYSLKGDKKNAIRYYELSSKYGDEEAKEVAKEEINKLKNK